MNTQPSPKQAVIYCRVSTKEQVEEGNSLVTQERNCREYAVKNGYDIAHVFVEQGESAKTADRTELQKLFTFCANKKNAIEAVIAYKIDRISRNTDDYSQIRILLKRYGVEIKSTSEYFENTPAGRFMENIIANVAQFDNDVRTERSIGGMVQALREGRYVWNAPRGYTNSRINGKTNLVTNEDAPLIKQAFTEVAGKLYSVNEVRLRMAALGICTKQGKPHSKSNFYRILKNETYMGKMTKFGEVNMGTFEPIVSPELFQVVQNVLKKKKRTQPYLLENPDFPLRRFITHPLSGRKLTGSWSKGKTKKYPYYRYVKDKIQFTKSFLEAAFMEFLDKLAFNEEFFSRLESEVKKNITEKARTKREVIERNKQEEIKLKEKQQALIKKNLDGVISDAVLKEAMSEIDEQLWKIHKFETTEQQKAVDFASVLAYLQECFMNPSKIWENLSFESKVKFQVFVFPKGVTFDGTQIRTPEVSFIFKLKEYFLDKNSHLVRSSNFSTNTLNKQISLPLTETDDVIFWQNVEKGLVELHQILTLENEKEGCSIIFQPKSKMKKGG